ncbi:MAG: endonuclease III [Candidatus Woesearchaeota archaeon]|jgi:endonuclease-3|nr:endonuclease III [Candidatus Woesearchaeota archaeon]
MTQKYYFDEIVSILDEEVKNWNVPVITLIALQDKDPFKVLISTILSLRTKDEVTIEASKRLYTKLTKPEDIYELSSKDIEKLIYPIGFYKRKSIQIVDICKSLVEKYDSVVPSDLDELLRFKGVGRKTANLVLAEGYQIPAICVDVHVHRISNRLGVLKTKNPEETEFKLQEILPKKYWIIYNTYLVAHGQHICRPISPICSKCPIKKYCLRIGVEKSR